jgi:hypothetical protein
MRFFGWVGCSLRLFFRWEFARGLDKMHSCGCRRKARINGLVESFTSSTFKLSTYDLPTEIRYR